MPRKIGAEGGEITVGLKGDPGEGVPVGGTTGQQLIKQSAADFDAGWTDVLDATSVQNNLTTHETNTTNPHAVTENQLPGDTDLVLLFENAII